MKKAKITIEGMSCASCANHVEKELSKIGGKNISVNPVVGKAFLETDATEEQLRKAVKEAGYEPVSVESEEIKSSDSSKKDPEIEKWKKKL